MKWDTLIAEMLAYEGYSIKRIAKEAGVSEATVRNLYAHRTKNPHRNVGSKLVQLYITLQAKYQVNQQ
ncbi:MAG: response regulator transcription factor [Coxiellaceae bacterium]|nr:MAG: response regulator transcription factor [Coxiellaceae bacterium]